MKLYSKQLLSLQNMQYKIVWISFICLFDWQFHLRTINQVSTKSWYLTVAGATLAEKWEELRKNLFSLRSWGVKSQIMEIIITRMWSSFMVLSLIRYLKHTWLDLSASTPGCLVYRWRFKSNQAFLCPAPGTWWCEHQWHGRGNQCSARERCEPKQGH